MVDGPGDVEREVYPRVGGGTSPVTEGLSIGRGLSPRGRGNQ